MSALPDLGATVEKFGTGRSLVIGVPVQDDLSLAAFGKPNEKPMFLNPAANPRPLRSEVVAEGSDAIGEKGSGSGSASSSSACREHAVMTSRMLTPRA